MSVPFLFPIVLSIIFAQIVHGNGTDTESLSSSSSSVVDDSLALGILMNGTFAEDSQFDSNVNGTKAKVDDAVERLAKTIIHALIRSIDAVVRFFGDILTKVTRSLDQPLAHRTEFLVNDTTNETQFALEWSEVANVSNEESSGNGTVGGASEARGD